MMEKTKRTATEQMIWHLAEAERLQECRRTAQTPRERKEIDGRIYFNDELIKALARLLCGLYATKTA